MNLDKIREKIMTDDKFVMSEFRKLQYLFKQQKVIRYNLPRSEEIITQSVAEHLYGMRVLADYFSKIEDAGTSLDAVKISKLITWHDIDEVETGDVIGFLKTDADRNKEHNALETVLQLSPTVLQTEIRSIYIEYKTQKTIEARFVKAIDKMEPSFFLLNPNGKEIFTIRPATYNQHNSIKEQYIKDFPFMYRFYNVSNTLFLNGGYFTESTE